MTDDEAEKALVELQAHYRQPVMPVGKYCDALRMWEKALCDKAVRTNNVSDVAFADRVVSVFREITKSNLLSRLIYDGETLREKPCPIHQGRWSGCSWSDNNCECQGTQKGGHGSNVTGWLP